MKKLWRENEKESEAAEVASLSLKIATYLTSGANLTRALMLVANESGSTATVAKSILNRAESMVQIPEAIAELKGEAWRVLAAAWHIARISGAPIADSITTLSKSFLQLDAMVKKRQVVTAAPKATILLISLLPLAAVLIAKMLGISLLEQYSKPPVFALLIIGLLSLATGIYWSMRMVQNIAKKDVVEGLEFDLVWIALSGGKSPKAALLAVVDAVDRFQANWVPLEKFCSGTDLSKTLFTATQTGSSVRNLLGAHAQKIRQGATAKLEKQAEKLSVRILIPLGVCVLPSFLMIAVIPLMFAFLE